jgi:hypothetical protein
VHEEFRWQPPRNRDLEQRLELRRGQRNVDLEIGGAAPLAVAGRRNEDDRSDRLVLVATALLLALANAQEPRRRFQPAPHRERDRLAFGDDDFHHQDALAPLLDDEPRLGRLEGNERHG